MIFDKKNMTSANVALAYVAAAWLIVQVATTMLPLFDLSVFWARVALIVLVLGFVPAVVTLPRRTFRATLIALVVVGIELGFVAIFRTQVSQWLSPPTPSRAADATIPSGTPAVFENVRSSIFNIGGCTAFNIEPAVAVTAAGCLPVESGWFSWPLDNVHPTKHTGVWLTHRGIAYFAHNGTPIAAHYASSPLKPGDAIFAFGFTKEGGDFRIGQGNISELCCDLWAPAMADQGLSGGPILNIKSELAGVAMVPSRSGSTVVFPIDSLTEGLRLLHEREPALGR